MAHFTVIGLGRFGIAASLELIHLGHTVTGVDSNPKLAEKYVEHLSETVVCDSTDEAALKELDLANSQAVLVAIGEDMQSSILCTLALKNLAVEQIWVKASTKAHHTIISKLGVTRIIHPEEEMGVRVAQALNYPMVNDYIALGNGLYVVEVHIKPNLHGVTIGQLLKDLKGEIEPLLVKRGKQTFVKLEHHFSLNERDSLLLTGNRAELKHIAPRLV
ncbi:trk system potassium uptake protein TrkA [Pseudoalteromonas nigrifaciens]|jgi:trk system potassium uptake protein TrkA|uniref:Trk system potassium uptake protein TrkA n=2 Tax=Pseudoalteromonas TaxID=53246 RepID=A0AAC9ULM9_9GAMM|nr:MULTISPECIES: TrkA family potassium uptake protein [Pseudoalteromonas]ASM55812.1 trk system potassium uptake protein TrkA [Pseudoalteromonas nigrifaciens]EWS96448.1 potassium transporter TrkA [Pseudoalteromonas sp. SCSIO_11900]MBE0419462.1 TrkA family potassium uptake protein [Pseudoalteromonas nigrifaciens]MBE0458908.1 TrkA family potassium uptake protein [Pseudoalteromonas prydzensis]SUD22959.1 Ktr system potassium uptake protein A [Pseudoalteromonas nigrifaciens]